MSSSAAIALEGAGKRYVRHADQAMLLKSLMPFRTGVRTEHWALRGIDLRVAPGEAVGVVGHNGAGKTTLLRLAAAVTRPTEGSVTVTGRVAPLIGLGVGFHPEMSGRENVYVNGMLLGLRKAEVDRRLDEIVAFAELEDAIDGPVKFYSSGMFMRLGFAVAIHVEPDVLLVDELLAVGDLAFQLKCFDRMRELKAAGTTILIVSHSMHAIRLLCDRAVLVRAGAVEMEGAVEDVTRRHEELLARGGAVEGTALSLDGSGQEGDGVAIVERSLLGPDGPTDRLEPGVPVRLRVRLRFDGDVESPLVHFTVLRPDGTVVYQMRSVLNRAHRTYRRGSDAVAEVAFTPHLLGGPYRLTTAVTSVDGRRVLAQDTQGLDGWGPPTSDAAGIVDLEAAFSPER